MKEKIVSNKDGFIPGIYNYCDLWCEKCPMTAKCMNYRFYGKQYRSLDFDDFSSRALLTRLSEKLDPSKNKTGRPIDLSDVDITAESVEEPVAGRENVISLLSYMSAKYVFLVDELFEFTEGREISLSLVLEKTEELEDLGEEISWYQYCIYSKLERAQVSKVAEEEEKVPDGQSRDSDGSAKVALIGIDRSIHALSRLLTLIPEFEEELLKMVVFLDDLKNRVEFEFPGAYNFVRPGFDETS